ncbi:MAG: regulatory protein RecX [Candidatus Omnitrophica bacterium]|nr:regulatory protein RecX [Candidatus Omnitrophota bacterium]
MKKQHVKSQARLNKPQSHNAEKARAYAFLLLKFRLRSEAELKGRLKQKGFSEELSQDTVNFLKDKEFIDDRVFAKGWVASRLKRPFGIRRIKQELIAKGLNKGIIEDSLVQAKKDYSEDQVVSQLAQQRFSRLSKIEPQKAKARVYAYLLRRGFSPDVVGEIIQQL